MTARRDLTLAKPELELKVATRALIRAAGGTDGAGETCGARQQRMSDCQNRNTPDFLRIDEVGALEDVTAGEDWPHVTRALARRQGFVLVPMPRLAPGTAWGAALQALGQEFAGTSSALCTALGDCHSPGTITKQEVAEQGLVAHFERLMEVAARGRALALAALDSS